MGSLVFVLGTGRCGSTVVQELLARHPDVGFISNLDAAVPRLNLKGQLNDRLYRSAPSALGRRDRAYLLRHYPSIAERLHFGPSEAYSLLRTQVSPILADSVRDLTADDASPWLARRFRSFLQERIDAQGLPVFMHKLTGWPRARFIDAVFPDVKFIHVVRDGRAVAASLVQRPWWQGHLGPERWGYGPLGDGDQAAWDRSGRDFTVLAGLGWKILMEAFTECREQLPADRWLELRFEDVVAEPRRSFQRALDFSELGWTPAFEEGFENYPLTGAHLDRYRDDLSARSLEALDDVLGPTLRSLGYSVDGEAPLRVPDTLTIS